MTFEELADILGEMYRNKKYTDQMTSLHMFGIKYANHIQCMANQHSMKLTPFITKLHEQAGILGNAGKPKKGIEVHQGVKLSQYVEELE